MNEHHDIDAELTAAGERLRGNGPDDIATRQALGRVKQFGAEPPTPRRSWWPALIGAGLAAVALVGVIVVRSDDTGTVAPVQTNPGVVVPDETTPGTVPISEPRDTAPETTASGVPSTGANVEVGGGCITVTTQSGTATGCPQDNPDLDQLGQRTFVADLGGPVLVTSPSSDPFAGLTVTTEVGDFATRCGWDDLAPRIPEGSLVELVVCNDTGVMGVTTGRDEVQDWAISYFTLPTPYLPDGTELGLGIPVDGMPGALAFVAPVQDVTTCSILLLADRSGWKEACGLGHDFDPGITLVQVDPDDPTVYEIRAGNAGVITAAQALGQMAPSSGCTLDDANDLMRTLPPSSIVMGIGCLALDGGDGPTGAAGSLTVGSVLTQSGPPDGFVLTADRDSSGVWTVTDSGTGIEDAYAFPIVSAGTWITWPVTTAPMDVNPWSDAIGSIEPQPDITGVADQVIAVLGASDTDPEFPLNERLLAVEPDGLPLIVAQIDGGGDDSVGGAVIYVWVDQVFDDVGPIGWQPTKVLAGTICRRGIAVESNLCL